VAHFVDTNLVVYAFQTGFKADRALALLDRATISVQVLNEFANVCLRKLALDELRLDQWIAQVRAEVSAIEPITEATHDLAREIVFRHKLPFYDAALLASALLADCETFYSEDLHDGMMIHDTLTIRNPFA
jgi:predicted nucleic acid-binding protein